MIHSISYSHEAFGDTTGLIERAKWNLEDVEYGSMVGTGLSGALVVPILARALHKPFAIIRKPGESSHAMAMFEGTIEDSYIFVDDFVSTGATRERVVKQIRTIAQGHLQPGAPLPRLIGTYQYATHRQAWTINSDLRQGPDRRTRIPPIPGCTCGCNDSPERLDT